MLNAGRIKDVARMDRVIELYDRRTTETDYGFRENDTLISTEWAEEIPRTRTMREDIMGGKESSIQEVHFRIRVETNVNTKYVLKYNGFYYDIITILPEGRDYQVLVTQLRPDQQYSGYSN